MGASLPPWKEKWGQVVAILIGSGNLLATFSQFDKAFPIQRSDGGTGIEMSTDGHKRPIVKFLQENQIVRFLEAAQIGKHCAVGQRANLWSIREELKGEFRRSPFSISPTSASASLP
jgi:hypothetical protein